MKNKLSRGVLAGAAALALTLGTSSAFAYDGPASWDTAGLKNVYIESGALSWSVDGIGTNVGTGTGNIQVNKPAGATVHKAFFMSAQVQDESKPTLGSASSVTLNGAPVTFSYESLDASGQGFGFNNYYADVTDILSTSLNAAATGLSDVAVDEGGLLIEGDALVVVWNDPAVDTATIFLSFGNSDPAGDNFSLAFPALSAPQLEDLQFSVGITYSYQEQGDSPDNTQASVFTVNGTPLTAVAGGFDDCAIDAGADPAQSHWDDCGDGALMTIGGVGDSLGNPTLPAVDPMGDNPDDELYSMSSFVNVGSTDINITTRNASSDDNVFFAGFDLKHVVATVDGAAPAAGPELANTGANDDIVRALGAAGALAVIAGALTVVTARRKVRA